MLPKKNQIHAIGTVIRRKMKGEANTALVNSDVNFNWNLIKKTIPNILWRERGSYHLGLPINEYHTRRTKFAGNLPRRTAV